MNNFQVGQAIRDGCENGNVLAQLYNDLLWHRRAGRWLYAGMGGIIGFIIGCCFRGVVGWVSNR